MADYWSNFRYQQGCFTLAPWLGLSPTNIWISFSSPSPETRMIFLPMLKTERSYLHSSGQNTGMCRTEGQTDRQNRSGYYSCLHCEQCGRAV